MIAFSYAQIKHIPAWKLINSNMLMSTQLPANNCNEREILEEPEIRTEAEKFLIIIHSKGVGFFSAVTFVSRHFPCTERTESFFSIYSNFFLCHQALILSTKSLEE